MSDARACGRCQHPRWKHGGTGTGPCHHQRWRGRDRRAAHVRCGCLNFVEESGEEPQAQEANGDVRAPVSASGAAVEMPSSPAAGVEGKR